MNEVHILILPSTYTKCRLVQPCPMEPQYSHSDYPFQTEILFTLGLGISLPSDGFLEIEHMWFQLPIPGRIDRLRAFKFIKISHVPEVETDKLYHSDFLPGQPV
jgi:hypothetical protein